MACARRTSEVGRRGIHSTSRLDMYIMETRLAESSPEVEGVDLLLSYSGHSSLRVSPLCPRRLSLQNRPEGSEHRFVQTKVCIKDRSYM